MANPTRVPLLPHQPFPVRPEVQAVLDGEMLYLCKTGEIDQLYRAWPCPNTRSIALHELIVHRLSSKFVNQDPHLVCLAGDMACVIAFRVDKIKGQPEASAFVEIPMSARRNLASVDAF